jgi:hypothetical protein
LRYPTVLRPVCELKKEIRAAENAEKKIRNIKSAEVSSGEKYLARESAFWYSLASLAMRLMAAFLLILKFCKMRARHNPPGL